MNQESLFKFQYDNDDFKSERTRVSNDRQNQVHTFAVDTMTIKNKFGHVIKVIKMGYDK